MKAIFILFFILYLGANYYVFYRIWTVMPPSTIGRALLIAFGTIAVLSFFIFFLLGDSLPIGLSTALYNIGGTWFFILIYFLIVFLLENVLGFANRYIHFTPSDAITRYTKDNWMGLAFILGFIIMLSICGYLKYNWKVKVNVPLTIEKTAIDSLNKKPLRIMALSDMHLGYGITKHEFEGWVDIINSENPDIVLIAGDIIDNSVRPLNENNFAEVFKKIKAPMGVYACLGNHEYISGLDKSLDFLKRSGVKVLRDSVAEIDSSFYIVGRDDKMNENRKPISELVKGLDATKPIIMLDHQPYNLEQAEENNIDLQISGHTHHGQVWPISLVTKMIYEKSHGYLKKGNTHYYISSGIGLWGGKLRIGTQSEYVIIDINKKE